MKSIRATYGAVDNSHKLIKSDVENLPAELEGLTDRPPGHVHPGETWFPSMGCGPVGEWWCLWWTIPDQNAERAGMVVSEVALWPLDTIHTLDDLLPAMLEVSGLDSVPVIDDATLLLTAESLLKNEPVVVVCEDLEKWPALIIRLWPQLWTSARKNFSCRVAISPPQDTHASQPRMYGVTRERSQQWQAPYTKIICDTATEVKESSRAALYLSGVNDDSSIRAIITAIPTAIGSDYSFLHKVSRVATGIDELQKTNDFDVGLGLLRTLIALLPVGDDHGGYKLLAVQSILDCLVFATAFQIESLANIDISCVPNSANLKNILNARCLCLLPELSSQESSSILNKLKDGGGQVWWQDEVGASLKQGLKKLDKVWAEALVGWLLLPSLDEIFQEILPVEKNTDQKLYQSAKVLKLSTKQVNTLRGQAVKKRWPLLHAWCAVLTLKVSEAFDAQYSLNINDSSGVDYLINNFQGKEVIQEALERKDSALLCSVARLTVIKPELLTLIDPVNEADRLLWAEHCKAGGDPWPAGFGVSNQGGALISTVLSDGNTFGLLNTLANELTSLIVSHPNRSDIWDKISKGEKGALLPLVAEEYLAGINKTNIVSPPEKILADNIIQKISNKQYPSVVVCHVLAWGSIISEELAATLVAQFTREDWKSISRPLGQIILANRWENLASQIYDIRKQMPEVTIAIDQCKTLLSSWAQLMLSFSSKHEGRHVSLGSNMMTVAKRVAEIGADLAHDPGVLEAIWDAAGGKVQNLSTYGSAKTRWQEAAKQAANGALPGGVTALVAVLKDDFPNNLELIEIEEVLNKISVE